MPRVAAGLSRWPFKPKYRVQLSDGVLGDDGPLDAFQQGRDYSRPICLVRLMVRPLASQARNMGSIPVLGTLHSLVNGNRYHGFSTSTTTGTY